jgi:hypothetical protein
MRGLLAVRGVRLLVVVAAAAALLAGIVAAALNRRDEGVVVTASAPAGWKTVEYRGVRVDVPADWERSDLDGCEFRFEHWAPPGSPGCARGGGVAFYAAATFDPATGPGVRRTEQRADEPGWGGYVYAGELAVYATLDDRDTVEAVLASARVKAGAV